jgi:hypothetical protein
VNVRVFEAETHASIFPVAVSAGLRFFLSAGGRRQSPD